MIILALALGLAASVSGGTPVTAAEPPWCSEFDAFTKNCTYGSYDECAAAIRGFEARCIRNPNYQPRPAEEARGKTGKPR
jgi:hypothetical protein